MEAGEFLVATRQEQSQQELLSYLQALSGYSIEPGGGEDRKTPAPVSLCYER